MEFVLDCSVTLAWFLEDEKTPEAVDVLRRLYNSRAKVPAIWPLEVANAVVVAERRKRVSHADSVVFRSILLVLPIDVDSLETARALGTISDLAREYTLSAYAAAYLELALRLMLPLATFDQDLIRAARRAKIPVLR